MNITALLTSLALVGLSACTVAGSGRAEDDAREVPAFHRIEGSGAFALDVRVGEPQAVHVTGDDNLVRRVTTTVRSGRLIIETDGAMSPVNTLLVSVFVPTLESIEISGAIDGNLRGVDVDDLRVEASGASRLRLEGTLDNLDLDVSGASRVDAGRLEAKNVEVNASGASRVDVFATRRIDGDLSGAATLIHGGSADRISVERSGASSISRAPTSSTTVYRTESRSPTVTFRL